MKENKNIEPEQPPENIPKEIPSQENILPVAETAANEPQQPIIPTSEIKNMEVHKHPHHITHKKKWGEYLLEFLMLFLAVFLGFVAENIREHISERENEKVYMQSLVQNIKNDISTIKDQQKVFDQRVILLDSLISILDAPTITSNTGNLYYYARMATKDNGFFGNTSTFDQMKSTGGLKLIKSKSVAESILSYYTIIDQVRQLQFVGEEGELNEYRKIAVQIFNADVFNQRNSISMNMVARPVDNPPLRTTDRKLLGDLAGWAHYIKNTRIGIDQFKKGVFEKGEKLIKQIEEEYYLENE